jgi:hypothetical protein
MPRGPNTLLLAGQRAFLRRPQLAAAAALATLTLLMLCRRAFHGLLILGFVDETGHIVGARVLHAGGLLYRDFVDTHGPLVYAIAQLSELIPRIPQPGAARLLMLLGTLAATTAIALSPCLRGTWERCCAVAIFAGLTSTLWLVQALGLLDYQPLAGLLLTIACAQFISVAWCGETPHRAGLYVSGAALTLVPFDAYAYAPAGVILACGAVLALPVQSRKPACLYLAAGAAAALAGMAIWMLIFCDVRGYIAYHFVENQLYFAPYINFSVARIPAALLPRFTPEFMAQSIAEICGLLGWLAFAAPGKLPASSYRQRMIVLLSGLAGLALTNPRANPSFQNGAFVLLAFAFPALGWPRLPRALGIAPTALRQGAATALLAITLVAAEAAARTATTSPDGYTRAQLLTRRPSPLEQSDAPWAQRLRQAVHPGEPILALPIMPQIYIAVGRPPMPGFDHYFPWDADYARHPWHGYGRDLCAALSYSPPPVIYDTDWVVWGLYAPKDYMPCLYATLAKSYTRLPNSLFYIRNDRMDAFRANK